MGIKDSRPSSTSARAREHYAQKSAHETHHALQPLVSDLVRDFRERLAIPPNYSINVELRCPHQMKDAYGSVSWDYLPSRTYLIRVRCDLDPEELEWIVMHELLELMTSDLAQFTNDHLGSRPRALQHYLDERHREIRDSTIEWLCHVLLGKPRPQLLLGQ